MAFILKDRVKDTTTTTGTGTVTPANAPPLGYQATSAIGNGNSSAWTMVDPATGAWECFLGTYSSTGPTLTRTTVLASSNGGSAVNFAAGIKDLFCSVPSDFLDDLAAIAQLAGTSGFVKKTAANAYTLDTATYLTANQTITLSGDASGSGTTGITVTLPNIASAGTYRSVTVNAKGQVTAGTNPTTLSGYGITDAVASTSFTWANLGSKPTTLSGFGITDAQGLDSNLTSIAGLGPGATVGFLKKTAANTWAFDTSTYLTANQTITLSGDLSGSGTTSISGTIAAGAVTLAKQANVATGTVFYRKTAGTGSPEVQTLATLKTDLGLTGTNSGDQTITLTGDVTGSGTGSFAATIAAGAVSLSKMANMATASLIYRKTAGSGAPEVQTLATLKTDLSLTGTNSGDQTITLTGDVTGSGTGSFAATIASGAVSLAKMANMATASFLGRSTAGTGAPEVLSASVARSTMGATTVGGNIFTLTNPSAITYLRLNADNSVSALDAATFRGAIGAGTGSGTVTSVAALTLGTTGTDLGSSVANGTTTPVITLNVPDASASARGALTSTDWSTFNGKQSALVSGTNIKTLASISLLGSGNITLANIGAAASGATTSSGLTMATARLLGRTTASTGAIEEISVSGLTLASGILGLGAAVLRNVSSGYTSGGQVFVSSTTPTASAAGDIWLDISGTEGFTQSLSSSGWTKLPNGLILQWMTVTHSVANGTQSNSLPMTFPNSILFAIGGKGSADAGNVDGNSKGVVTASSTTSTVTTFSDDGTGSLPVFALGY